MSDIEGLICNSAPRNHACRIKCLSPYIDALSVGSDRCERMEFLGDAVLQVVVTQYLYERFPSSREGFLSKMRSKIVSSNMLFQLGKLLNLSSHVQDHRTNKSSCALDDILEALIAAICIDAGMEAARTWFINVLEHHVDVSALVSRHDSGKQRLLNVRGAVTFTQIRAPRGKVTVCVKDPSGSVLATATAESRKDAEEQAALKALSGCPEEVAVLPRQAIACHVR